MRDGLSSRRGCVDFSAGAAVNALSLATSQLNGYVPNVFTWVAWVYMPVALPGGNAILFDTDDASVFSFFYFRGDRFPQFSNSFGVTGIGASVLALNKWYFMFVKCDGATTTGGYRTPQTKFTTASDAHVWKTATTNLSLFLGEANGGSNYNGFMAAAQLYNYAIPNGDLFRRSQQLAPLADGGLLSYLPMNSAGSVLADAAASRRWTKIGSFLTSPRLPPVPEIANPAVYLFVGQGVARTLYFKDAAHASSSQGTLQDGGTAPSVATTTTGFDPGTQLASNYGEQVYGSNVTSFGATVLPNGAPGSADCWQSIGKYTGTFSAGNWTFAVGLIGQSAVSAVVAGNLRARVWRSTDVTGTTGTTEITNATVALSQVSNLLSSAQQNTTATFSMPAATLSGEYLFVQFAWQVDTVSAGAAAGVWFVQDGTNSIITTSPFVGTYVTNTNYTGSVSESVSAPTDAVGRAFVGARPIAENASSPTDAVARAFVGSRSISENESVPTDMVSFSQVLSRGVAENVSIPTDAIARALVLARAIGENVAPPSDVASRSLVSARMIGENESAPTDNVARILVMTRAVAENVSVPVDALTRSFVGARATSETLSIPSDAVARVFVGARTVAENDPSPTDSVSTVRGVARTNAENITAPTDAVVRVFVGTRPLSENVPIPSDVIVRGFSGARTNAENVPVPTDVSSRVFASTRNLVENVPNPNDLISRVAVFARIVVDAVTAAIDAVARMFVGSRNVAENIIAPTDAASHSNVNVRNVAESIGAPIDSAARSFVGARHVFDAVTVPTDSAARSFVTARFVVENVPAPGDVVARIPIYVRGVVENVPIPSDSPIRSGQYVRVLIGDVPSPIDVVSYVQSHPYVGIGAGRLTASPTATFAIRAPTLVRRQVGKYTNRT